MDRRTMLRVVALGAGTAAFSGGLWEGAFAAGAVPGPSPYGEPGPVDANGVQLPPGFTSRIIGRSGQRVSGTSYTWHWAPDGGACFADGTGWIYVSNSEIPFLGGASSVRFAADGRITGAYRILSGTRVNCAGGATPWGTWLSCEEHTRGQVWECDPRGKDEAVPRPAMGIFEHEAVAVDPHGRRVYLTEDNAAGGFYRFTPENYPDLSSGKLAVARLRKDRSVEWVRVPDPSAATTPTREQVDGMTRFNRGEGIWFDSGIVYLCTTNDSKIHTFDTKTQRM